MISNPVHRLVHGDIVIEVHAPETTTKSPVSTSCRKQARGPFKHLCSDGKNARITKMFRLMYQVIPLDPHIVVQKRDHRKLAMFEAGIASCSEATIPRACDHFDIWEFLLSDLRCSILTAVID